MRKYVVLVLLLTLGLALPAQATPPEYVEGLIEATVSGNGPHAFESGLLGCPAGTLEFVREHGTQPGPTGVSHAVIDYEFDCNDGGFVIRLNNVQYSPPVIGSTGHWTVLASWGNMEGLHANGTIVGHDACSGGGFCILDVYSGRYHFAPQDYPASVLIPNQPGIHDRTTYSSERNDDGTYTITLGPDGSGQNGIPTGTPFCGFLRAYSPVEGADMTVAITSH